MRVSLTPGSGLSVPLSEVTLKAGDGGTRFRVSADLNAIPGDSSLRASVDLSVQNSIQALVPSTTVGGSDRPAHDHGVFRAALRVTLMRGDSTQVKVRAVPALQANESIVLIPASSERRFKIFLIQTVPGSGLTHRDREAYFWTCPLFRAT